MMMMTIIIIKIIDTNPNLNNFKQKKNKPQNKKGQKHPKTSDIHGIVMSKISGINRGVGRLMLSNRVNKGVAWGGRGRGEGERGGGEGRGG